MAGGILTFFGLHINIFLPILKEIILVDWSKKSPITRYDHHENFIWCELLCTFICIISLVPAWGHKNSTMHVQLLPVKSVLPENAAKRAFSQGTRFYSNHNLACTKLNMYLFFNLFFFSDVPILKQQSVSCCGEVQTQMRHLCQCLFSSLLWKLQTQLLWRFYFRKELTLLPSYQRK